MSSRSTVASSADAKSLSQASSSDSPIDRVSAFPSPERKADSSRKSAARLKSLGAVPPKSSAGR